MASNVHNMAISLQGMTKKGQQEQADLQKQAQQDILVLDENNITKAYTRQSELQEYYLKNQNLMNDEAKTH